MCLCVHLHVPSVINHGAYLEKVTGIKFRKWFWWRTHLNGMPCWFVIYHWILLSCKQSSSNGKPDSMIQWQDCRPECWEAWGPEFNPRPGRVGVRFLYKLGQPPKTLISCSLLSVAQLLGDITLKSFIFISCHRSCYLCRLHIYKSSPSKMSEPPLKKGGEPFI